MRTLQVEIFSRIDDLEELEKELQDIDQDIESSEEEPKKNGKTQSKDKSTLVEAISDIKGEKE